MTKKFPANLRSLVDQAICNLWDKNCPLPDLSPLGEWLEVDGWDYVVDGIYSSYADMEVLKEFLSDEMLIEYDYAAHTSEITDAIKEARSADLSLLKAKAFVAEESVHAFCRAIKI